MSFKNKLTVFFSGVIYWSIIMVPFVASFSSAAVQVFIGFMIFALIVKKAITKDFSIVKTPINLPFVLIIAISLLSFINSVKIQSSVQGIVKLLMYGFLIIIMSGEIKDIKHFVRVIISILIGLFLSSFDGVYQLVFHSDLFRHQGYNLVIGLPRIKAAFPDCNVFAGYLALFVPFCVPLLLYYLKGPKRILSWVVILPSFFCLFFTFSRSGAFGVWLSLLLMGIIKKDKIVLFSMVLILLIGPFLLPGNIKDWSKSTTSLVDLLLNKERPVLYETSFNMIKHHPIVGVGVNTYVLNYQKYKLHDTSPESANTNWYAHNSFLQMASEIGITGFLIFVWLLYILFSKWFTFYKKSKDGFLRYCSLGAIMGIVAFLIHGLTETNLYYPKIAVLFWFEVGLVLASLHLDNKAAS